MAFRCTVRSAPTDPTASEGKNHRDPWPYNMQRMRELEHQP